MERLFKGASQTTRRAPWFQQRGFANAAKLTSQRAISRIPRAHDGVSRATRSQAPRIRHAASHARPAFSSSLRPNLTGGCLPRTAGGYGTGAGRVNGVRQFSSSPAPSADVINNVSAAVRAFWLSGQRAAHDGRHHRGGATRFRAIPAKAQEPRLSAMRPRAVAPSSYIEFDLQPHPLTAALRSHEDHILTNNVFLMDLETGLDQHAAAYKRVLLDLKLLQSVGALPISAPDATHVRVHFPGKDGGYVERLCIDIGLQHGIVFEETHPSNRPRPSFDFRYPTAPTMKDPYDCESTACTHTEDHTLDRWISAVEPLPRAWAALSDTSTTVGITDQEVVPDITSVVSNAPSDFEGFEGIYRFLDQLDHAAK